MRTFAVIVSLLALLQQAPVAPQSQKIAVTVTDKDGRFVPNLRPEDFVVEEDGVRQEIASFSLDSETPVSLGVLIDRSTSMRLPLVVAGKTPVPAALLAATGTARALVRMMKPQDEFLLMTFDDDLNVRQNFTQDQKKLTDLLYKMNTVGGATHLYDSISKALQRMEKAKYKKRALIVITDVHDTSGHSYEDLLSSLRQHEIGIYTFGMRIVSDDTLPGDPLEALVGEVLEKVALNSGGNSLVVDVAELRTDETIQRMILFVQSIAAALRGQYTISYNSDKPGSLANRVIRVRTSNPEHRVRINREQDPTRPNPKK
jgi:VWFA-related protein